MYLSERKEQRRRVFHLHSSSSTMKDFSKTPILQAGDVLIAHPNMPGNLFSQTLVYLHTHKEEGSLGFILNRPSGHPLSAMVKNQTLPDSFQNLPLSYGGPVQDDHFLLTLFHCDPQTHRFRLELNPDRERLEQMSTQKHCVVKAFLGHAGWTAGQLEAELSEQDWMVTKPDEVMLHDRLSIGLWDLFSCEDQRWQSVREQLPVNPALN